MLLIVENWVKMTPSSVCFGSKGDSYGAFTIPTPGKIITFKLTYLHGNVNCFNAFGATFLRSRWGCRGRLGVHITYADRTRLLPANTGYMIEGELCYGFYYLPWATTEGEELRFDDFSSPLSVSVGEEYQVWFTEDLTGCIEIDNSDEQTCTEVYGLYAE